MSRKLERNNTALVVIDLQDRILPVMEGKEELLKKCEMLIKGATILGIPIVVTEQYPKGLGPTNEAIKEALGDAPIIEKTTFSAMETEEFRTTLEVLGCKQIIVCGIEAHVCVQQTVLDLLDEEYDVVLACDCCASRTVEDRNYGFFGRMQGAGCHLSTAESVLFEILKGAKEEGFKEISNLVK